MSFLADGIKIRQTFDPTGERGGYRCDTVEEDAPTLDKIFEFFSLPPGKYRWSGVDYSAVEKRIICQAENGQLSGFTADQVLCDDIEEDDDTPRKEKNSRLKARVDKHMARYASTSEFHHHGNVTGRFSSKDPATAPASKRAKYRLKAERDMRTELRRKFDVALRMKSAELVAAGYRINQIHAVAMDVEMLEGTDHRKMWFQQLKDYSLGRTGKPPAAMGFCPDEAEDLFDEGMPVPKAYLRLKRSAGARS